MFGSPAISAYIDNVQSDWKFLIQILDSDHIVATASSEYLEFEEFSIYPVNQVISEFLS